MFRYIFLGLDNLEKVTSYRVVPHPISSRGSGKGTNDETNYCQDEEEENKAQSNTPSNVTDGSSSVNDGRYGSDASGAVR